MYIAIANSRGVRRPVMLFLLILHILFSPLFLGTNGMGQLGRLQHHSQVCKADIRAEQISEDINRFQKILADISRYQTISEET